MAMNKRGKIALVSSGTVLVLIVFIFVYLNKQSDAQLELEKKYRDIYKTAEDLYKSGYDDKALAQFTMCVGSKDYGWQCETAIYKIYREQKQWKKLIEFGLSCVDEDKPTTLENRYRWYMMGYIYKKELNDLTGAEAMYRKIDQWFIEPTACMELAKIYKEESNFSNAEEYAKKALTQLSQPGYHYPNLTKDDAVKLLSEIAAAQKE